MTKSERDEKEMKENMNNKGGGREGKDQERGN